MEHRDETVSAIKEAFFVDNGWCRKECLKSITVDIKCEPEILAKEKSRKQLCLAVCGIFDVPYLYENDFCKHINLS